MNAVKAMAAVDFQRDREAAQAALSLLASFAKGGRQDLLGLSSPMSALSLGDIDEVTGTLCLVDKGGYVKHFCSRPLENMFHADSKCINFSQQQVVLQISLAARHHRHVPCRRQVTQQQ